MVLSQMFSAFPSRLVSQAPRAALWLALLAGLPQAQAAVTSAQINTGTTNAPTGTASFNALPASLMPTADTCTSGNNTTYTPGNDPCGTDLIIRTNDVVTYQVQYTTSSADTVTVSSVLPLVAGVPVADWTALPPQCGAGSSISANKQTLTCVIAVGGAATQSILPQATVRGTVGNGTAIAMPATTISGAGGGNINANAAPLSTTASLTVSAAPLFDVRLGPQNGSGQMQFVKGPDGVTDGWMLSWMVAVRAPYGTKGVEAMNASGITLTSAMSSLTVTGGTPAINAAVQAGLRANAQVYNLSGAWVSPVATIPCGGVSTVPGAYFNRVAIYGRADGAAGHITPAANGTCTATQAAAGADVSLAMTGVNWANPSPMTYNITPGDLPYGNYVADNELALWVPATVFTNAGVTSGTLTLGNGYTNISGTSISGQALVQPLVPDATLGGTGDDVGTFTTPNFTPIAFFDKRYENCNDGAPCGNLGFSAIRSLDGRALPGQKFNTLLSLSNTSAQFLTPPVLCDKLDNTKNTLFLTAGDWTGHVDWYSTKVLTRNVDYVVEFGIGGLNGVGSSWANNADFAAGSCADDQSPTWYSTVAAAGGAPAITKFRIRMLTAVPPTTTLTVYTTVTNTSPSQAAGFGMPVGTVWPVGTKINNWGTAATPQTYLGTSLTGTYNGVAMYTIPPATPASAYSANGATASGLGDTINQAGGFVSLTKEIAGQVSSSNPSQAIAGNNINYVLKPVISSPVAGAGTATTVTVKDILPANTVYLSGSASVAPSSILNDTPAAGMTTLVWTVTATPNVAITPITYQATLSGLAANGDAIPNLALISSPADPSPDCSSSGFYAGYTKDGTASTATTLCPRAARRDMTASAPPGFYVFKSGPFASVDLNGNYSYTLSWNAVGSPPSVVDLIDVLPYSGDGAANAATGHNGRAPATVFSGTTALPSGTTLAVSGDAAATFWYTTTAPGSINRDPADASNGAMGAPAGIWLSCPGSVCPATATAVRMVSGTAMGTTVRSLTLPFQTSGNVAGNQYTNDFSMRGAGLANLVTSNDFTVSVVTGSIAGTVYNDNNNSGTIDLGETGIANVQMCLSGYSYGPNGVDNSGGGDDVAVAAGTCTTTNASGVFTFANLGAGKYTLTQTRNFGGLVGMTDGIDTVGTGGGTATNGGAAANDVVTGITVPLGGNVTGYNFGERLMTDMTSTMVCTDNGATGTCVATCKNTGTNPALNASCQFTGTLPVNVTANTCVAPSTSASLAAGSSLSCTITMTLPINGAVTRTVTAGAAAINDSNGGNVPTAGNNPSTGTLNIVPNPPKLTITKVSIGGKGDTFTFTGDNGWTSQDVTPAAAGAPGTPGAQQTLTAAGVATTITEVANANYTVTDISCTGMGTGGTFTPDLAARSVTLDAAAMAKAATVACTFTNTKKAKLTVVKSVPAGQGIAVDFAQTGVPATATGAPNAANLANFSLTPSAAVGSMLVASQVYDQIDPGTAITLNELKGAATAASYGLVNVSCTNAPGAGAVAPFTTSVQPYSAVPGLAVGDSIGSASFTTVPGADVTCTFSNVKNPKVVLVKNTVGGDNTAADPFKFTATSSFGGSSINTLAGDLNAVVTAAGAATVNTEVLGLAALDTTDFTFTEAAHANFMLNSLSCTNLGTGTVLTNATIPALTTDLPNRSVTLTGVGSGDQLQCTFTNAKNVDFAVAKTWVDGKTGDAVNIPASTGFVNGSGPANTPALPSTATGTGNNTDTLAPRVAMGVGSTGTLPSESFTTGTAGDYASASWVCGDGVNPTTTVAQGASLTLPLAAAGAQYTCTLTNSRQHASLVLAKTWANALVNDNAALSAVTSPGGVTKATFNAQATAASQTNTGTANQVGSGDILQLGETLGGTNVGVYTASAWSCTGGGSLTGSKLTVLPADAAKTITCTVTNTGASADMVASGPATVNAVVGTPVSVTTTCANTGPGTAAAPTCVVTGAPAGATTTCSTPASPFLSTSPAISCVTQWTPTGNVAVTLTTTAKANTFDANTANNQFDTTVNYTATVAGRVYVEASSPLNTADDGNATDIGLGGVTLNLSCTGPAYNPAAITTAANGTYSLAGVPVGATCTLTQTQPAGYTNAYNTQGAGATGTTGDTAGSTGNSSITLVVPATGTSGNNFAEEGSDMVATASCSPLAAVVGDVVTCTATCTNNGNSVATSATCRFTTLPAAGLISNTCSTPASSASLASTGSLSCTAKFTASVGAYTVRAGAGAGNDVNGGANPASGNNASNVVNGAAVLAADMTSSLSCPASAVVNTEVTCTATCTNNGPGVVNNASCQFLGALPAGVIVSNSCVAPATAVALAANGSLSCTLNWRPNATGAVTLRAGAAGTNDANGGADPAAGNNPSQAVVNVGSGDYQRVPALSSWMLMLLALSLAGLAALRTGSASRVR